MASISLTTKIQILPSDFLSTGLDKVPNDTVSLTILKNVFGGNQNVKLSDYYSGGMFVENPPPTSSFQRAPIPTSTSQNISLGMFLGVSKTYLGSIIYPNLEGYVGKWILQVPPLPRGWGSYVMTGDIIAGGGGGGGGWASAQPVADPAISGAGGGASQLINISRNDLMENSFIYCTVGNRGLGGAGGTNWDNYIPAGSGTAGTQSDLSYNSKLTNGVEVIISSPGTGGGAGSRTMHNSSGTVPIGGSIDGQNGRRTRDAGVTGGNGGSSSIGAGGAGGFGGNGTANRGGDAFGFGGGGGGGGADCTSNNTARVNSGGHGSPGRIILSLTKGT